MVDSNLESRGYWRGYCIIQKSKKPFHKNSASTANSLPLQPLNYEDKNDT